MLTLRRGPHKYPHLARVSAKLGGDNDVFNSGESRRMRCGGVNGARMQDKCFPTLLAFPPSASRGRGEAAGRLRRANAAGVQTNGE